LPRANWTRQTSISATPILYRRLRARSVAVFANPSGTLIDGQLWEVDLEAGKPEEQVVVPQAALLTDQQGVYVFIVEDGKVAIRRIKTGGASGADIIVTEGLSGNELVVVQGFETLRPGTAVRATPVPAALSRS